MFSSGQSKKIEISKEKRISKVAKMKAWFFVVFK
jgi:hypothetical protein